MRRVYVANAITSVNKESLPFHYGFVVAAVHMTTHLINLFSPWGRMVEKNYSRITRWPRSKAAAVAFIRTTATDQTTNHSTVTRANLGGSKKSIFARINLSGRGDEGRRNKPRSEALSLNGLPGKQGSGELYVTGGAAI